MVCQGHRHPSVSSEPQRRPPHEWDRSPRCPVCIWTRHTLLAPGVRSFWHCPCPQAQSRASPWDCTLRKDSPSSRHHRHSEHHHHRHHHCGRVQIAQTCRRFLEERTRAELTTAGKRALRCSGESTGLQLVSCICNEGGTVRKMTGRDG